MLPPMTIEESEEIVNQTLESLKSGEDCNHEKEWNRGFTAAFQWTQRRLADFKELYVLKSSGYVATAPEPVKPIPFKVGQTLRRTSDGLKCMIAQGLADSIYLLQLNNGRQFSKAIVSFGRGVSSEQLAEISGGYTFVTEKQGLEMGLAWAREEASRDKRDVYAPMVLDKDGPHYLGHYNERGQWIPSDR